MLVEWEPVSNLQRRIEAGFLYEHFVHDDESTFYDRYLHDNGSFKRRPCSLDDPRSVPAIFFGYTMSTDEIHRLRSAHPDDPLMNEDYIV